MNKWIKISDQEPEMGNTYQVCDMNADKPFTDVKSLGCSDDGPMWYDRCDRVDAYDLTYYTHYKKLDVPPKKEKGLEFWSTKPIDPDTPRFQHMLKDMTLYIFDNDVCVTKVIGKEDLDKMIKAMGIRRYE